MANSFTQLHIQFIFAIKYRAALILPDFKIELHKYITGIIQNNDHKLLSINSMPDHIHFLIGLRPNQAISALVQKLKATSNTWINDSKFSKTHFAWQEGFAAFSYSKSSLHNVINYIENQEKHHSKVSFLQEYENFLKAFGIEYDRRNIFKELI
jgi:putative transposase